jgi:hypothetical protein
VKLFNPRDDSWDRHFKWDGVKVFGKTPVGRATAIALDLNNSSHLIIRGFESRLGRHPPPAASN